MSDNISLSKLNQASQDFINQQLSTGKYKSFFGYKRVKE
jgi:hypothetical protein